MNLTKGYLTFLLQRFKKCEGSLKSIRPKEMARIKDEVKKGNKKVVGWVLSVLQIFEYDFKKERLAIEKYLARELMHSGK
jgi:hypothetical protein